MSTTKGDAYRKSPSLKPAIRSTTSPPSTPTSSTSIDHVPYKVGDKIYLSTIKKTGVVKFIGKAHFATGLWVGVELPDASGKNNGSVLGQRYFSCKAMHGVFVRPGLCHPIPNKSPQIKIIKPESFSSEMDSGAILDPRYSTPGASSSTRPILRKTNDDSQSKIKSVAWSDNLEVTKNVPEYAYSPPSSSGGSSGVMGTRRVSMSTSSSSSTPSSPGTSTENLLGRIDSALTKSQFSRTIPDSSSSPASSGLSRMTSSSSSTTGTSRQSGSSTSSSSQRQSPPSTGTSTLSKSSGSPRASLPTVSSSVKGNQSQMGVGMGGSGSGSSSSTQRRSLGGSSSSSSSILGGGGGVTKIGETVVNKQQQMIIEVLSDSKVLETIAALVQDTLFRNTENMIDRAIGMAVEELKDRVGYGQSGGSSESLSSVNERVDGLDELLGGISNKVDTLILNVESFMGHQQQQVPMTTNNNNDNSNSMHNGHSFQSMDGTNTATATKELEAQVAYLKQALTGVAQLTRQAMDATTKERWEQSQYAAKLETRLRKLEIRERDAVQDGTET